MPAQATRVVQSARTRRRISPRRRSGPRCAADGAERWGTSSASAEQHRSTGDRNATKLSPSAARSARRLARRSACPRPSTTRRCLARSAPGAPCDPGGDALHGAERISERPRDVPPRPAGSRSAHCWQHPARRRTRTAKRGAQSQWHTLAATQKTDGPQTVPPGGVERGRSRSHTGRQVDATIGPGDVTGPLWGRTRRAPRSGGVFLEARRIESRRAQTVRTALSLMCLGRCTLTPARPGPSSDRTWPRPCTNNPDETSGMHRTHGRTPRALQIECAPEPHLRKRRLDTADKRATADDQSRRLAARRRPWSPGAETAESAETAHCCNLRVLASTDWQQAVDVAL